MLPPLVEQIQNCRSLGFRLGVKELGMSTAKKDPWTKGRAGTSPPASLSPPLFSCGRAGKELVEGDGLTKSVEAPFS